MSLITFIIILFIVLLAIGVPIGFLLGIVSLGAFFQLQNPMLLKLIPQRMFAGVDVFVLMCIPFFIFAGEVMNSAKITDRLIDFSNAIVGHFRGGLAHINIVASIFFAGITGSAVADTVALGTVLIPAMEKEGYDLEYSAAVTCCSSNIGPIIPPSVIMVIYAVIMQVSVAGLFAAGLVPGVMIGLSMMVINGYISRKRGYPKRVRVTFMQFIRAFFDATIALIMPFIILGGILSGIFTPTEAAAIASFYGLVVGFFFLRTLKIRDIYPLIVNTVSNTAVIFLIIATANIFGWLITSEQMADKASHFFMSITDNPYLILFIVNVLLLFAGMILDTVPAMIILGPLLGATAINLGIHPLHFAIVMCTNLTIGLVTPPVGTSLFAICSITGISLEKVSKASMPFIIGQIAVLFLITYFPAISMTVPRWLDYVH